MFFLKLLIVLSIGFLVFLVVQSFYRAFIAPLYYCDRCGQDLTQGRGSEYKSLYEGLPMRSKRRPQKPAQPSSELGNFEKESTEFSHAQSGYESPDEDGENGDNNLKM